VQSSIATRRNPTWPLGCKAACSCPSNLLSNGYAAVQNLTLNENSARQPSANWTPIIQVLNLPKAEVIVCSAVPYAVLAEIFELCQKAGKWRKAVSTTKKKHGRHGDELNKLEELLGNMRSEGIVMVYSAREDAYIILPLV
jgi:hypothetical protein